MGILTSHQDSSRPYKIGEPGIFDELY